MAILVDYRCTGCGTRAEHWAPSPPPAVVACATCGADSRRLFAGVRLAGSGQSPAVARSSAGVPGPKLCAQFPQVPGLCHMSPSAGRMWVAKYLKDGRRIDREQERQEKAAAISPPTLADAVTHHHHPGPVSQAATSEQTDS